LPVCPHLHFEDGFGPEEADGRQLPRRVWLRRLALSGQSRIVVPSRTLEAIATRVWRFAPHRVLYIPNGIDTERCAALAGAAPLGLRRCPGEILIGGIGLLRPEKNFARLIRAFARAARDREARLVIAGDGPERGALEALAAELGIAAKVTFTGFLERPEEALVELDLFALSSDTEQMPLGMVEAMAAGLPVVATDVGDVRALLPEAQRAYVVAKEDEAAFTAALGRLLDGPELRRALGAANRPHARERYGLERMVSRYASLFASMLEEGPGRRPSVATDSAS
jgi:glycosyltransferase involved in cell wall biosynthesis